MNVPKSNCINSGLHFEMPYYDSTALNNYFETIPANIAYPQPMTSALKVSFSINQLPQQMIDGLMSSINLKFKVYKLNEAGEKEELDDMVAFVAGGLYSAISKIELCQDGNTLLEMSNVGYMHHLINMLSRDSDYLDTVLTDLAGFGPDRTLLYDDVAWDLNDGLYKRYEMCQKSKLVELQELLIIPPWATSLNLIPSLNWVVKVQFQDPAFFLQHISTDTNKYVVDIQSVNLIINRVNLREETYKGVQETITRSEFGFPFTNYHLHAFNLPDGGYEYRSNHFNLECFPRRLFLAVVDEKDKLGQGTTTPFNYKPLSITQVEIEANGRVIALPETNFTEVHKTNTSAYKRLTEVMGIYDRKFSITKEDFNQFYAIFGADLTYMNTGDCTEFLSTPKDTCTLIIRIKFSEPIPSHHQVVLLTESDYYFGLAKDQLAYIKPIA